MRIVIALGGNAILQRNQALEESLQRQNVAKAARVIAQLGQQHDVIITHGNGPQVGLLSLQNDAYKEVSPYSLDVLGAETEGMIGYLLAQELKNAAPNKKIIALLTQTLVEKTDSAFKNPTKFVGPVYDHDKAMQLAKEKCWTVKEDGQYFRRVVPSPKPIAIIEDVVINNILKIPDIMVICTGGGGIPVIIDEQQKLQGIEAVVDKDRASNVLAQSIHADALIILTDVAAVETNFQQANSQKIKTATPDQLSNYIFAKGSMHPKVEAAIDFVNSGGKFSAIGALTELTDIFEGSKGTRIIAHLDEICFY